MTRPSESQSGLEIAFRPDYSVWDGRFACNAWLQELPRPLTKLVWDNAAWVSPATARARDLNQDDVVRLTSGGRSIEAPLDILPGTPDGTITLHLGYGHDAAIGRQGGPAVVGVSAFALRPTDGSGFVTGVTLEKLGRRHTLVMTRSHHAMTGVEGDVNVVDRSPLRPHAILTPQTPPDESETANRKLVRVATIEELRHNPQVIRDMAGEKEKKPLLSLYPGWDYGKGYQWGMSIDQTACIGCGACVVACQAENNIPVVGKEEVARQREMHWLRIDDYFGGDERDPRVFHQPVPCMHCEDAPCEVVCPTGATTHSVEGLNQMTYNRCVGTRYCSNNCPYKVRRFNFLHYTKPVEGSPPTQLLQNPEVTVRTRGVMEKCTYCVQRLQRTRIEAERLRVDAGERSRAAANDNERELVRQEADAREFDLLDRLDTACAQACPTRAITFGSVLPVAGRKTRLMVEEEQTTDYVLLRELTTKPRTSYLGRLTNPNPALVGPDGGGA